ncbi:hypothetical protein PYJP_01860 [Pyrofollis japonicus]|uniref:hypothetical protein n=1 Tax=Pyrofollis japonicus TaxID=3060460 RepID=UPI00295B4F26|nr:hypothetical protein [Pyrofollis japonicus]BEP16834.1 hypothetical protein PYJP_01860 [Pyrofollis japonicus]
MHISKTRYTLLIVIVITLAGILVYSYDDIMKSIDLSRKSPLVAPTTLKTITMTQQRAPLPSVPAELREEVVNVIMSDAKLKKIFGSKKPNISGILPLMDREGNLAGGCAIVSFSSPSWLEINEVFDGKHLQYIGWVKQLTICVNTSSMKIVDARPSLSTRNVPKELPNSISPETKKLVERILSTAKNFLGKQYGLGEDDVDLIFYGAFNNIAVVVAAPKAGGKLINTEILMKIDVKNMKVTEAYAYTPKRVSVVPNHTNTTAKSR